MQIFFSNNTKCSVQNNASEFVQEHEEIKCLLSSISLIDLVLQ